MPSIPTDDEGLLLDLLNSTPVINGVQHDELADTGAARRWLASHELPSTPEEIEALLELRPVLQGVVRGRRSPREFEPFLAGATFRAYAVDEGLAWRLEAPPGHSAATRALLAWDDLRLSSPGRLRPCANTDCALFLIDRSKPNTARWCSMATCGNRLKARRHYQKSRETDPVGPQSGPKAQ